MTRLLSTLLAEASARRPDHPAVLCGARTVTYARLADQAGRIAAALQAAGVHPGDRVGLFLTKSIEKVAALYGVLWAGAAYVPVDPGAPEQRIAYMVRNCGMSALLTRTSQVARLKSRLDDSALERILLVDVDAPPPAIAERTGVAVDGAAVIQAGPPLTAPAQRRPDDLAYILYTSGSTGDPKGVMISHENALAFVRWAHDTVAATGEDHFSSHAPFHFDLSVFDLYACAMAGATLHLVPDGLSVFPARLAEWIEREGITIWYSVPSILVQMLERGGVERFAFDRLREVVFAGEVFATKYLRQWMERLPDTRWHNWYGPTETNVCTAYRVPGPPAGDAPVSIGQAASGDRIILVDDDARVIDADDAVGEIWVDGPTVALGYWGDEEKTASRFTPAPGITGDETRRIYRTGDLACRDADGNLIFKGRRDHMIKCRGYRIELGDVEAAVYRHPAVQEACAVAVPDPEQGNRIRVCVALHAGAQLDREGLERHLLGCVQRYMLPQEVVFLSSLPKTSTGKIDRRMLAAEAAEVS